MKRFWGCLAAIMMIGSIGGLAAGSPATRWTIGGATITVTTIDDEYGGGKACSLREAIQAANTDSAFGGCAAGSGADAIVFSDGTPTTTFTLGIAGNGENSNATGDLDIIGTLTISGNLSDTTNLDGARLDTILDVRPNANVILNHLTIRNGLGNGYAGGISNNGTLTINDSSINNNETSNNNAGGIFNGASGVLTLNHTNVIGNVTGAGGHGAGIYNRGRLSFRRGSISDNSANGDGAGLFNNGGAATISDADIHGNTALGNGGALGNDGTLTVNFSRIYSNQTTGSASDGGAIFNTGATTVISSSLFLNTTLGDGGTIYSGNANAASSLTIRYSEISLATATGNGGGIFNNGGLNFSNVTISGNKAANGSGIYSSEATDPIQLVNVTIANNKNNPDTAGGGIRNAAAGSNFHLRNTLVANNGAGANCSGALASDGNNLDSGNSCSFGGSGDIRDANALLGPLAINNNTANPSFTHALISTSPAIDAGANCPANDQRAVFRPRDGNNDTLAVCDIGAFEAPGNAPPAAAPDTFATEVNTQLAVAAPGLLANDSDIDNDTLAAVIDQQPSHGALSLSSDGGFTYMPDKGFHGLDLFRYHVSDGHTDSGQAAVSIRVGPFVFMPLLVR